MRFRASPGDAGLSWRVMKAVLLTLLFLLAIETAFRIAFAVQLGSTVLWYGTDGTR